MQDARRSDAVATSTGGLPSLPWSLDFIRDSAFGDEENAVGEARRVDVYVLLPNGLSSRGRPADSQTAPQRLLLRRGLALD